VCVCVCGSGRSRRWPADEAYLHVFAFSHNFRFVFSHLLAGFLFVFFAAVFWYFWLSQPPVFQTAPALVSEALFSRQLSSFYTHIYILSKDKYTLSSLLLSVVLLSPGASHPLCVCFLFSFVFLFFFFFRYPGRCRRTRRFFVLITVEALRHREY
jgi:small-conductance mechanosensitive channel